MVVENFWVFLPPHTFLHTQHNILLGLIVKLGIKLNGYHICKIGLSGIKLKEISK